MTGRMAAPSRVGMLPAHCQDSGTDECAALVRPPHQRSCAAPLAIAVALMLAVTTLLVFIAITRYPAPASTGHRTGTQVAVPHPAPGPFGS